MDQPKITSVDLIVEFTDGTRSVATIRNGGDIELYGTPKQASKLASPIETLTDALRGSGYLAEEG